ncbi:MAG TPA: hypothetical protein VKA46_03985 [Gemmataceae bacterium]|nr:hypothetical protein [Gemmataceae bacterium]
MSGPIRNRIKAHRRVRAGDLVPHEFNYRLHPETQRAALEALYRQVGFARSLLAYELPDGRLKLIDGHLRRDIDPDMEVEVEVLDVNDDEARTLLLTIDPLAKLAEQQEQLRQRLTELAPPVPPELAEAWQAAAEACLERPKGKGLRGEALEEQWYVLVTCRDEKHQVELLGRFKGEGLTCKAVLT